MTSGKKCSGKRNSLNFNTYCRSKRKILQIVTVKIIDQRNLVLVAYLFQIITVTIAEEGTIRNTCKGFKKVLRKMSSIYRSSLTSLKNISVL